MTIKNRSINTSHCYCSSVPSYSLCLCLSVCLSLSLSVCLSLSPSLFPVVCISVVKLNTRWGRENQWWRRRRETLKEHSYPAQILAAGLTIYRKEKERSARTHTLLSPPPPRPLSPLSPTPSPVKSGPREPSETSRTAATDKAFYFFAEEFGSANIPGSEVLWRKAPRTPFDIFIRSDCRGVAGR